MTTPPDDLDGGTDVTGLDDPKAFGHFLNTSDHLLEPLDSREDSDTTVSCTRSSSGSTGSQKVGTL